MERTKRASIEFSVIWKSAYARHRDRLHFPRIIFWRDIFPGGFGAALPGMTEGEERAEDFDAGVLVPSCSSKNVFPVMESQIDFRSHGKAPVELRAGRFYPRGIVQSPYTFPKEARPFRGPWVPVVPILGVLSCMMLMFSLPSENWLRLIVWLVAGLFIYLLYGRHHSVMFHHRKSTAKKTG